ncbi:MAG: cbb3-type cytochrome oxidase assembly protein CcoS [Lysobacterales bacterium]
MNILLVLIPVSVALIALAIWAFFWAVDNGQFDDLDSPALDMLRDEPTPIPPPHPASTSASTSTSADSQANAAEPSK